MAISRIGYYNTGASPGMGSIGADKQRAYVPDALGTTVIFYELGCRLGRTAAGIPTCRLGIGTTSNGDASGSPSSRKGYSNSFVVNTQMSFGGDGVVTTQALQTPFLGNGGDAYALVLTSTNYALNHGMIQYSEYPNKDNYNYYDKSNASSIPTDPIGGSSIGTQGHMALWATGEVNVPPNHPTALSPVGTLASTDLTPTMGASFSDSNETLPNGVAWDYLNDVQIVVRRQSDHATRWDYTYTAGSSERAARRFTRSYAGTALSAGTVYEWRCRFTDRSGAFGPWSNENNTNNAWDTFTINAGGSINTSAATFTGKQNAVNPSPFVAQWNHPNPLNANAAIVRLLDSSSNVVQQMSQGSPVTVSVASGSNISITYAATGFPDRPRGWSGYWQMQARDTSGAWMDSWSAKVPFSVNAIPNIPTGLSPTNSTPVTAAPKLTASATDPDDVVTAIGVTGQILRADGTTVQRALTYNATTKKFEYQTVIGINEVQRLTPGGTISGGTFTITVPANVRGAQSTTGAIQWNATAATVQTALEGLANVGAGRIAVTGGPVNSAALDLTYLMELSASNVAQVTVASSLTGTSPTLTPSTPTGGSAGDWAGFQTLQWRAQSSDSISSSAYSAYATFLYGNGPQVTVTAPTDESVIATATSRITWTVPSGGPQAKYRVQLTEVDVDDVPVVNGIVYDTFTVTSTNLFHDVPTSIYRNGRRFELVVTVTNATPLSGSSQPLQFTITYTPPSSVLNFTATPDAMHVTTDSDSVRLAWTPTTVPADQIVGYDVFRTPLGPAQQSTGFIAQTIDETIGERLFLRRIPHPAQFNYIDANLTSGVLYQYDIELVTKVGLDELRSAPVSDTVSIMIPHVVLVAAKEPETYGVEFRYKSGKGGPYVSSKLNQDKKKVVPVGGKKGRSVASPFLSWDDSLAFELVSDRFASADELFRDLSAMVERGGTLNLRSFDGLKRFLTLEDLQVDRFTSTHFRVSAKFSEEFFSEGESL